MLLINNVLFDEQNMYIHRDTSAGIIHRDTSAGIKLFQVLGSCSTAKQRTEQKEAKSHLCLCFPSIHSNHL